MRTTINLWHSPGTNTYGPARYKYESDPIFSHNGVEVFKVCNKHYDYVFAGATIAQRGGFDKSKGKELVQYILSCHCPMMSDVVIAHIKANQ